MMGFSAGWLGLVALTWMGFQNEFQLYKDSKSLQRRVSYVWTDWCPEWGWLNSKFSHWRFPKLALSQNGWWILSSLPFQKQYRKSFNKLWFRDLYYTLKRTYLPWYLKGQNKRLTTRKKRIQSLRHLNQILVHTPPPTQPAPLPTWQTTAPPVKRGCVCFNPPFSPGTPSRRWNILHQASAPWIVHTSATFHRHPRWFRSDDTMTGGEWSQREEVQSMHKKKSIMEETSGCLNEPQPLLRFFFFWMVGFHRSFLDCWGQIV